MPSLSSIFIGAIVALAIALAGTGYWLSNVIESRAQVRASLNTALEANASLVGEAKRAKADAAAEAERAMQRQRERDGLAANVAALRQRLSDASNTCVLPAGDLDAIDRFLRGER